VVQGKLMTILNFTAIDAPIANQMIGQTVKISADIAAATTADQGTFHIFFVVQNLQADGITWKTVQEIQSADKALTTTPQTCVSYYKLGASAPTGNYKVLASVRDSGWVWQHVSQTASQFTVSAIPLVNGIKMYVPPTPAPADVVPLVKQADGSYLPSVGTWDLIPGMSILNADVLDTTKWRRKYWSSYGANADHFNDELERYIDSAVDYQNGQLVLTATPRAGTTGHAPSATGIQYPVFDSGMVRSVETAQYFYSEMEIVLPHGMGVWPAYWIIPGDGAIDPNPEMDMMEYVVNGANETTNTIHLNCSANKTLLWHDDSYNPSSGAFKIDPSLYGADYWLNRPVKVSILWLDDDTMTLYHDGVPTAKWHFPWVFKGAPAVPATIMIDFAIGGNWPTASWQTAVPTGPVQTFVNYLKTYALSKVVTTTQAITKYGAASPV
jgi:beta-glucanase (GH16 family)